MFLVVFRNRKRADIDRAAYEADAEAMQALAEQRPGYLSFKSYAADDGEVVAISEWQDEASALGWRRVAEHQAGQERGRNEYYAEYTLFTCDNPRIHRYGPEDPA